MKRVVLVGATDGIGLALAREYATAGWSVGVLGRDPAKLSRTVSMVRETASGAAVVAAGELDLGAVDPDRAAPPDVAAALGGVARDLGGVDLIVYCAGVLGGPGDVEEILAVNTRGAMAVLEWGAARFSAEAGGGHLAAIGSVAGDRGRKGNPAYAASKAGLHAYLEGLRARLHPAGVRVTTVKPGWVRTRMLGDVPAFPPSITAEQAARRIRRGLDRGREVFYVPSWWGLVSLALRLMPRWLFKRVAPP